VRRGRITKRGDDYLRTLWIQGAKSALMTAHKRTDKISQWLVQLLARVSWQKAVVALANKNARILWALLAKGREFDPNCVSVKPGEVPPIPAATAGEICAGLDGVLRHQPVLPPGARAG
jgi:transposase